MASPTDGHEFEQAPGVGGPGGLRCCSPWSCKESDMTERLNWKYQEILVRYNCSARCPNPWAGREKALKTMQFTKRVVYYWLESGLSATTNAVVHGQKSLKQRLLAKFIRYAYAVSSWLKLIGYMFAKQFYWYKLLWAFQLSLCFPLGAYWLAGSRLPDGVGNLTISGEAKT